MASLTENTLVQETLERFAERLHSKVPLQLRHVSEFIEEAQINQIGLEERSMSLRELMGEISKCDIGIICDTLKQLDFWISEGINECTITHKGYKSNAESLVKTDIDQICETFKMELETKILDDPTLDLEIVKGFQESGKLLAKGTFHQKWNHGNVLFIEDHKRRLEERLEALETEICERQRRRLESISMPVLHSIPTIFKQDEMDVFMEVTAGDWENVRVKVEDTGYEIEEDDASEHLDQFMDASASAFPRRRPRPSLSFFSPLKRIARRCQSEGGSFCREERPRENNEQLDMILANLSLNEDMTLLSQSGRERMSEVHRANGEIDSLVFRLNQDLIVMGTCIGNKFETLCNAPNLAIDPTLRIDEHGNIIFGQHPTTSASSDEKQFNLEELLRDPEAYKDQPISFRCKLNGDGMGMTTAEVNLEFLLGVILRKMKASAEMYLIKEFHKTIITVPLWLTSIHRIKIKSAAKLAGFLQVDLLNQESIAGYAFASRELIDQGDILVLSSNFNILSAILYHWHHNQEEDHLRKLRMVTDLHFCMKHVLSHLGPSDASFWQIMSSIGKYFSAPLRKVIFVTESPTFMKAFSGMAYAFGFEGREDYGWVPSTTEMFGCSILSEEKLDVIYGALQEYLPGVVSHIPADDDNESFASFRLIPSKTMFPISIECELPMKLFQKEETFKITQECIRQFQEGVMVTIGEIELKGKRHSLRRASSYIIQLTLEISSEAIVSLVCVKKMDKSGKMEELSPEEFVWTTHGFSDGDMGELRLLMESINTKG